MTKKHQLTKLYDDDNRKPVQDDLIRIKDLQGNRVEDRARAFWMYLLRSKGIDPNLFW